MKKSSSDVTVPPDDDDDDEEDELDEDEEDEEDEDELDEDDEDELEDDDEDAAATDDDEDDELVADATADNDEDVTAALLLVVSPPLELPLETAPLLLALEVAPPLVVAAPGAIPRGSLSSPLRLRSPPDPGQPASIATTPNVATRCALMCILPIRLMQPSSRTAPRTTEAQTNHTSASWYARNPLRKRGGSVMTPEADQQPNECPECRAPRVDGMGCWEQLGGVLAWEAHDAELAAVHFLTVASYNLQHPAQFTDDVVAGLRDAFKDHLERGRPVAHIRRQNARTFNGSKRVLRPEAEQRPRARTWKMTIADVYIPDRPEGAAARVRAWAEAIRGEL